MLAAKRAFLEKGMESGGENISKGGGGGWRFKTIRAAYLGGEKNPFFKEDKNNHIKGQKR